MSKSKNIEKKLALSERTLEAHKYKEWKSELSTDIERQLCHFLNYKCLTNLIKDFWDKKLSTFDVRRQALGLKILYETLIKYRERQEAYINNINTVICECNLDNTDLVLEKLNKRVNRITSRCSMERQRFVDALKAVRFAMGYEETKPHYKGIFVEVSKGKMRCYAGTGSLFAVKEIKSEFLKDQKSLKVFLPAESINHIITSLDAISSPIVNVILLSKGQLCVITSDYLNLRIENIPDYKFPQIDKLLNRDFPHKLCININDLKPHIASICAAVKAEDKYFPKPVGISIDNGSGQLILRHSYASITMVPLSVDSVVPDVANSSLIFSCYTDYLAKICKHWSGKTEIVICCEMNGNIPVVVYPKNKEAIRSNKPDVIFFATRKE